MRAPTRRAVAVATAVLSVAWSLGLAPTAIAGADPCPGMTAIPLPDGSVTCTHGDDDHFGAHVAADGQAPTALRRQPVQCFGDGTDGYRVSVLYVHAAGTPDRGARLAGDIRRDVEQVEAMVVDSAADQGGRRHVRWETEAAGIGCRVRVRSVAVPGSELGDLTSTIRALGQRGFARADRRYAMYVDHDRYCGIATVPRDAKPGPDNSTNHRTGYARVDRACWNRGDSGGYATMAHELFHTLGAVLPDAPNATEGGHCRDEWDPLCYDDGSGQPTRIVCRAGGGQGDSHRRQLDCNADDYFAVAPPRGSFLDRSWNTADSAFLSTEAGRGSGGGSVRDVPTTWPAARGAYLPSSSVAGFEDCDAPITVDTRGSSSSTLLGTRVTADSGLVDVAREVVDRVNALAGTTVLELGDPVGTSDPAAGTILLDRASGTDPQVTAWARGGRTTRVLVALPGQRPALSTALAPVLEGLGLGSVPWGDKVTGRLGGPDAAGTRAALRHLHGSGCSDMARLDLRAGGHPSQLGAIGTRRTLDLAPSASSGVALGVEVAGWLRQQSGQAPRAVVCRDDDAADCLAGAGLLVDGGPLVFVPGGPNGSLPDGVANELGRSVRAGGRVLVLGGPQAVSARVFQQLQSALPGRGVDRLFGDDRFETAAAVARRIAPNGSNRVLLARGDNPADATAAAALAARDGLPVLLTAHGGLLDPAADYLRSTTVKDVVLLGGPHALSGTVDQQVDRFARSSRAYGQTRTSTAVAVARSGKLWNRSSVGAQAAVVAVPGFGDRAWQATLAAAPVAAHLDAPIVYLAPDHVPGGSGGEHDTTEYVAGLEVRGADRVTATSVVVGARLGGLQPHVSSTFHALVLPALRDRMEVRQD